MKKEDIKKLIEIQKKLESNNTQSACGDYILWSGTCDYGYTRNEGLYFDTCEFEGNPYDEGDCRWEQFENENCGGNYSGNCVVIPDPEPEAPPTPQPDTDPEFPEAPVLKPNQSSRWNRLTDNEYTHFDVNGKKEYLPYNIFLIPVLLNNIENQVSTLKIKQGTTEYDVYDDLYNDWKLNKTSYKATILKNPPFPVKQNPNDSGKIDISFVGEDKIVVDVPSNENLNVSLLERVGKYYLGYRSIDYNQNINDTNTVEWNYPLLEYFNTPRSAKLNQPLVENRYFYYINYLDPKLLSHQFSALYIKDYFSNFYEYNWEYLRLWKNNINQVLIEPPYFKPNYKNILISALHSQIYYNSLNPENITEIIKFPLWNANSSKTGNFVINNIDNSLPLAVNEYQEYLRTNSSSINTQKQITNEKLGIETQKIDVAGNRLTTETSIAVAGGVLGAIGSVASGKFGSALKSGAVAAAAGVRGVFGRQELGIRELEAGKTKQWFDETIASSLIDKSRLPNTNRIFTSNFWELLQNPDAKNNNLSFSSIDKERQDKLNKFFNEYGYLINESDNINKYLGSRYYFNYIQAKDAFNTINLRLSSPIKQIINNALDEGVTIWHYRKEEFWNGVLSYKYQNWENELFEE